MAQALGVAGATLHYWLHGANPRLGHMRAIERYTRGAVPVDSWMPAAERKRVSAIAPFDEPRKSA